MNTDQPIPALPQSELDRAMEQIKRMESQMRDRQAAGYVSKGCAIVAIIGTVWVVASMIFFAAWLWWQF